MKQDIILAGVGGQGVLSIAAIIAKAAVKEGLGVRQSEVHGMAQRGVAVLSHLRISATAIASDLVPQGEAGLIISMEPLESLRYLGFLSPKGALVSASEPLVNIPNYPAIDSILQAIAQFPLHRLVDAGRFAKVAGNAKAVNMVMVGAAAPFLPVSEDTLRATIADLFAGKGDAVIQANRMAFDLGNSGV